eukprot:SAG31_NODE_1104_length_9889_cov_4.328396_8_plen_214_part_00
MLPAKLLRILSTAPLAGCRQQHSRLPMQCQTRSTGTLFVAYSKISLTGRRTSSVATFFDTTLRTISSAAAASSAMAASTCILTPLHPEQRVQVLFRQRRSCGIQSHVAPRARRAEAVRACAALKRVSRMSVLGSPAFVADARVWVRAVTHFMTRSPCRIDSRCVTPATKRQMAGYKRNVIATSPSLAPLPRSRSDSGCATAYCSTGGGTLKRC